MPPKTRLPEAGDEPILVPGPDAALAMIDRLIAVDKVEHQSPAQKALLCRSMADAFTATVDRSFRALDVPPWDGNGPAARRSGG